MTSPVLRTIFIDPDAESRAALRRILAGSSAAVVVGEFSDVPGALLDAPARRPDLAIVALPDQATDGAESPVRGVEELSHALRDTAIFAIGPSVSADFVIRVIRAGAVEFLSRPLDRADVLAALNKLMRFHRGSSEPPAGRVTSVFSTKGGLGVTTIATNLAVCLATGGAASTLLVDLDNRHSDVATFLNLRPTYSVLDAFENVGRMDESFLRGLLIKHASGLWVLPGPTRIERIQFGAEPVRVTLEMMRTNFDHVVLDLRHDLDPGTITALEASDTILFLTGLDVAAVRSGVAGLAAFRQLGISLQKVRVVVMREDTGDEVTVKHVREALGLPIVWKIPSDYPTVVSSINSGQPLVTAAPRSKITRALRQLAEAIGKAPRGVAPGGAVKAEARQPFSLKRLAWTPKGSAGV
jgi:pilus assembly protein CpaE